MKTKRQFRKTAGVLLCLLLTAFGFVSVCFCVGAKGETQTAAACMEQAREFGADFTGSATGTGVFEQHEHRYLQPDWIWADDYSSAAAVFTCSCGDVQTVDAEITAEEVTPADCTNDQVVIYTAAVQFGGDTFTDETGEITVPHTAGHVYGIRITPATCTHDGITTYKCVRCGSTYTKNPVPAMGHRDDDHNGVCDNCGEKMPGSSDTPPQSGVCSWCGKTHRGFWQSMVGFLHKIFGFWVHLFGKR